MGGKSNVNLLVVTSVHLSIAVLIIAITSIWTFLFTYCFLKKTLRRHETNLNLENFDVQKSLYTKRVKNLIGIFGALLLCNTVSWLPIIISNILSFIVDLPPELDITNLILWLFNSVMNPVVQIYFRKELCDSLTAMFKLLCFWSNKVKFSALNCCNRQGEQTIAHQLNQANLSEQFNGVNHMSTFRHHTLPKERIPINRTLGIRK